MTSSTCSARGTGDGGQSVVIIASTPISGILLQYNALAETCLGHACDAFAHLRKLRLTIRGLHRRCPPKVANGHAFLQICLVQTCCHTGELIGTAPEQLTLTFRTSINKHRSLVHGSLLCIIISNKTRRVHLQKVVGLLCNTCVL
jgi:hypothetical protein